MADTINTADEVLADHIARGVVLYCWHAHNHEVQSAAGVKMEPMTTHQISHIGSCYIVCDKCAQKISAAGRAVAQRLKATR